MVRTRAQCAQAQAGSPVSVQPRLPAPEPPADGICRRRCTSGAAATADSLCHASQVPIHTANDSAPCAAGRASKHPGAAIPIRGKTVEPLEVHSIHKRSHDRDSSPDFVAERWGCPAAAATTAAAPVPVKDFKGSEKHGHVVQCASEAQPHEALLSAIVRRRITSTTTSSDCVPGRRTESFSFTSAFASACSSFASCLKWRLCVTSKPLVACHLYQKNSRSTRCESASSNDSLKSSTPDDFRSGVPPEVKLTANSTNCVKRVEPSVASNTSTADAHFQRRLRLCQLALTYWCYASLYLTRKPFASARRMLQVKLLLSTEAMGWIDTAFLLAYALTQLFLAPTVSAFCHQRIRAFFLSAFVCSSACCFYVALAPPHMLQLQQLLLVWGVNGAAQALVFPFLVAILQQWLAELPGGGTGTFGVWSTCQQLGSMAASYVTGEVLSLLDGEVAESGWLPFKRMLVATTDWRSVFFIPGVIVLASGIVLYAWLIDSPLDYMRGKADELTRNARNKRGTREWQTREVLPRAPAPHAAVQAYDAPVHEGVLSYGKEGDDQPMSRPLHAGSSVHHGLRFQSAARAGTIPPAGGDFSLMIKAGIPLLSGAYFCMKLVRYALISWLPLLLETEFSFNALETTTGANLFEMGGVAGAISVGYISQQFLGGRCFAIVSILCTVAASASWCLWRVLVSCSTCSRDTVSVGERGIPLSQQLILLVLGASIAGPDSVLGGMAAASAIKDINSAEEHNASATKKSGKAKTDDPSQRKKLIATASCTQRHKNGHNTAISSGVVNGSGSIGSVFQGPLTPLVISTYGWQGFLALIGCACAFAGILLLPLLLRDVKKGMQQRHQDRRVTRVRGGGPQYVPPSVGGGEQLLVTDLKPCDWKAHERTME